jgi:hypothetical protein
MGLLLSILLLLQRDPADEAILKGIAHLKSHAATAGERQERILDSLVALGAPATDREVAALLKRLLEKPPETTRAAALQARILWRLSLGGQESYRERLGHCAQFLVDNQSGDGRWGEGRPVDPPDLHPEPAAPPTARTPNHVFGVSSRVLTKIPPRKVAARAASGDPANSFWAILGLSACETAGMILPKETLEKAERSWRVGEIDPAQRIIALSVCLSLLRRNPKEDPDVRRAEADLESRPFPTDPGPLELLKEAMTCLGREKFAGRDWQRDGGKTLLMSQAADGGWGSLEDTCAALRFLDVPRYLGIPEYSRWRRGFR